jgi:hypothetical protein
MCCVLIGIGALLLFPVAAGSQVDGTQQQVVALLNRAVAEVYAKTPACRPVNPFDQTSTLTDSDPSADLLATFAIFRRPGTAAELGLLKPERGFPAQGLYRRYARIATSSSGRRFEVFAAQNARFYTPRSAACISAFRRAFHRLTRGRPAAFRRVANRSLAQVIHDEWAGHAQGPTEGLFLFGYAPGRGGGGGGTSVAFTRTHGMFGGSQGRSDVSVVSGLVPDGVAAVTFRFGVKRRPSPPLPAPRGAPATTAPAPKPDYPRALVRTVAVRDNVVSVRVRRALPDALSGDMTWLAADGSVVRRVKL